MRNSFRSVDFKDKKTLYIILTVIVILIATLSIAFATLSATLTISGLSEIVASTWDIHLENPVVKSGSVSTTVPTITGRDSLNFNTTLTKPGDYYEFTVDVVNAGSLDAMIDSVVKTPELTTAQAKYLTYEITYQNGESINAKQNIAAGATIPIKVRLEYRKDLSTSDLPSTTETLSLALTLVYVQSDGTGTNITDNDILKAGNVDLVLSAGFDQEITVYYFYPDGSYNNEIFTLLPGKSYKFFLSNVVKIRFVSTWGFRIRSGTGDFANDTSSYGTDCEFIITQDSSADIYFKD